MKIGKKVREYKAGDFIFAKVKGYPAWPARVQKLNGKKYFVYFYGTAETANLPPNMIFDYAENKDKFLTKTVKRRDFNDGVRQIEYDFANNIPLEQVIGVAPVVIEGANDTANESTANDTVEESTVDTTAADDTLLEENDTGIEDSDETGALVIDEAKQGKAGRKSTSKTPAKETPKPKEPKTPRGRGKKEEETKEEFKEDDKKEEEIISRSGRKIRPKRYIDEQTEENATLPSPAPKKRRGASPVEKEKEKENKEKEKETKVKEKEKNIKHFNAITQAELEDLKEPFTPDDPDKENIIIAYLPSGQYIGVKLFQSRPNIFKNEGARLQWDKQAASNALTLKMQLEKGHITAQSVVAQLVMDLNLTDEEKATLDKDRETEEKKSRVQFLKTEMKLIELDAKIKTCLCLEKADTELCLKLLDELMELDVKPLMLLKHPTTLETIKRMRAYVGNTPSWELSENAALLFSQHAHKIRKQADTVYNNLKDLFQTPEGLSFWEFFTERVAQFKKATSKLTSDELLELVHEPLDMSVPTSHTMKAAIEAANEEEKEEEVAKKNTATPAKTKKTVNNTSKPPLKRQASKKQQEEKEKEQTNTEEKSDKNKEENDKENKDNVKETNENTNENKETKDKKEKKKDTSPSTSDSPLPDVDRQLRIVISVSSQSKKDTKERKTSKDDERNKESKDSKEKDCKNKESKDKKEDSTEKESEAKEKPPEKTEENADAESKKESSSEDEKKECTKETEKEKSTDRSDKEDKKEEKDKAEDEPRAKRSRESKKTDPPPRSPTKRKSKF